MGVDMKATATSDAGDTVPKGWTIQAGIDLGVLGLHVSASTSYNSEKGLTSELKTPVLGITANTNFGPESKFDFSVGPVQVGQSGVSTDLFAVKAIAAVTYSEPVTNKGQPSGVLQSTTPSMRPAQPGDFTPYRASRP